VTDHAVSYDRVQVVRREWPESWVHLGASVGVDATWRDLAGVELDTGPATTPDTHDLTAAATRGTRTLTAESSGVSYQWQAGDLALLTSPGGPVELVTVSECTVTPAVVGPPAVPASAAIVLRDRLEETHAIGALLIPWWCDYSLDATDTDEWTASRRGTVTWEPDAALPSLVDTWQVRALLRDAGALRKTFREVFARVDVTLRDDAHFVAVMEHCEGNLKDWLRAKGTQVESLADRGPVQRLLLTEIAHHIAVTGGEELSGEAERLGPLLADQRTTFAAVTHAQDADQDHVIGPADNRQVQMPPIARQW